MRKLSYDINLAHLRQIKDEIVPALFTEHQFRLLEKKGSGKKLNATERNEFSRSVSRKMRAIQAMLDKQDVYVCGGEKMISSRIIIAKQYIKRLSRKFKGKHIFITGSYLYKEKYNDIDVFIISKYDKEDYVDGSFHFNYLTESVLGTLFFASASKLCISNKVIQKHTISEEVTIDTFISLYQELFNDLDKDFKGVTQTLREFLLQSAYMNSSPVPDSSDLSRRVRAVLSIKRPKELIKKIFINTVVMGVAPTVAIPAMKKMIRLYSDTAKEYKQHKKYYSDLIEPFKEVIAIES